MILTELHSKCRQIRYERLKSFTKDAYEDFASFVSQHDIKLNDTNWVSTKVSLPSGSSEEIRVGSNPVIRTTMSVGWTERFWLTLFLFDIITKLPVTSHRWHSLTIGCYIKQKRKHLLPNAPFSEKFNLDIKSCVSFFQDFPLILSRTNHVGKHDIPNHLCQRSRIS